MALTKTVSVTGGNTSLAFECVSALVKDSSVLAIIACRDVLQGEQAAQRGRAAGSHVEVLPLDFAKQTFAPLFCLSASRLADRES